MSEDPSDQQPELSAEEAALLRERLRRLDPAAGLEPTPELTVARLLAQAREDQLADLPETRQTGVHDRSRLTWLVAAAALVLIAGVGAVVLLDRDGGSTPAAAPTSDPSTDVQSPVPGGSEPEGTGTPTGRATVLGVPAGVGSARCAVPAAEVLSRQTLAFDAVVSEVQDGLVTLTPSMFFAGEPTTQVEVQAPPEVLQQLLLAVDFQEGERYLVAATGGEVAVCGYTGAWTPDLEQLYLEAFPG
ncbi:hypothetical protein [Nocardioides nanhaiensis]|uniref:Uncharacterized protein n=1 Tax=Nocardioides nanhaiensis TaxID=1476871 RepID=A0ABP8VWQ1_9ACTN